MLMLAYEGEEGVIGLLTLANLLNAISGYFKFSCVFCHSLNNFVFLNVRYKIEYMSFFNYAYVDGGVLQMLMAAYEGGGGSKIGKILLT